MYWATNVLISDHLTVFCVRKKRRENTCSVFRIIRDYKNYSRENFIHLLRNSDWNPPKTSQDPNGRWGLLYGRIIDILSTMCPFKQYKQREVLKPWLTAEIYREIRYREKCLSVFMCTGCQQYYELACKSRNKITSLITWAKANYFKTGN